MSTDVLPQRLEPAQLNDVKQGDPYFLSMMLNFDDRPVDLKASVVPVWSKNAVYRSQPGTKEGGVRFDVDDTEAASFSLFVDGISPGALQEAMEDCALVTEDGNEVGVTINWVVDEKTQSLGDLHPIGERFKWLWRELRFRKSFKIKQ